MSYSCGLKGYFTYYQDNLSLWIYCDTGILTRDKIPSKYKCNIHYITNPINTWAFIGLTTITGKKGHTTSYESYASKFNDEIYPFIEKHGWYVKHPILFNAYGTQIYHCLFLEELTMVAQLFHLYRYRKFDTDFIMDKERDNP